MFCRTDEVAAYQSAREPLAQLVEHLTFNQRVGGSNPPWLTILVFYVARWSRG